MNTPAHPPEKVARAHDFVKKAQKWVRWSAVSLTQMRVHETRASMDDVDRIFTELLARISSIHEALDAGAGIVKAAAWQEALEKDRQSDPLLKYLWKARDSETHDAIVKWRGGMKYFEYRVVDAAKTNRITDGYRVKAPYQDPMAPVRLMVHLVGASSPQDMFEKLKDGALPSPEAQAEAGVEMMLSVDTFKLEDFDCKVNGKMVKIASPKHHMGKGPADIADKAIELALGYYESKAAGLLQMLPKSLEAQK